MIRSTKLPVRFLKYGLYEKFSAVKLGLLLYDWYKQTPKFESKHAKILSRDIDFIVEFIHSNFFVSICNNKMSFSVVDQMFLYN